MRILDLFSGAGGFSLGFHAANFPRYDFTKFPHEQETQSDGFFETVGFCDIEPFARKLLARRFPGVPIYDDVRNVTGAEVGRVDIVTGGFPCQDLSVAQVKKNEGLSGHRSGLFVEMLRIARECDAKYIVFENSAELVCNRQYFAVFADSLRRDGWRFDAFLFTAEMCGYPHERRRAYVVAYADKDGRHEDGEILRFINIETSARQQLCAFDFSLLGKLSGFRKRGDSGEKLPDIRKSDGLSRAVDRIGMMGNSLIPAIPRMLGLAIRHRELLQ